MGYPVSIQEEKYERNVLLFNLCFVFEKGADTESYEQVVMKVARVLKSLEVALANDDYPNFSPL